MKLILRDKEIWNNNRKNVFLTVANNGGTFYWCSYSLNDSGNAPLLGVRKHLSELALSLFIKQEFERILHHRVIYMKL